MILEARGTLVSAVSSSSMRTSWRTTCRPNATLVGRSCPVPVCTLFGLSLVCRRTA